MAAAAIGAAAIGAPIQWAITKVLDELFNSAMDKASRVVYCKDHVRDLQKLVEDLQPIANRLSSNSGGNNVWLLRLKNCLMCAVELIQRCSESHPRNMFAIVSYNYNLSPKLLEVKRDLDLLLKEALAESLVILTDIAQEIQKISYPVDRYGTQQAFLLQPMPDLQFGVEEASQHLQKALLKEEEKWVGIWGQGGCGKTLLAQRVNNSKVVQDHFQDGVYWIIVSQEPDIPQLQSELYKMVTNHDRHFDSAEEGRIWLFNSFKDKKALLILDDVWKAQVLDCFDVLSKECGSKILVTSRNKQVVNSKRGFQEQVQLLNQEDSMRLFCAHAFPSNTFLATKHSSKSDLQVLEEQYGKEFGQVVEDIVAECKNLPLALKVIGASLAGKTQQGFHLALKELQKSQGFTQEQEELAMYKRLKLSYDDLGRVTKFGEVLQQCFLYFAAFPEGYTVQARHLIKYWVGEGLIQYNLNDPEKDEAYYILGELSSRSLIEITRSKNGFKMHDVLRDMAFFILRQTEPVCLLQPRKGLATFPHEWTKQEKSLKAHRLSLMHNQLKAIPSMSSKFPELKVLLLNSNWNLHRIEEGFFINFQTLQVLDLSHSRSLEHLPNDIGELKNLVVLDLRYNTKLISIPSSIGQMIKLEYLDLSYCKKLNAFPVEELSKLVNLRYLDTFSSHWDACTNGLECISHLTMLRTLHISSIFQEALPISMHKLVNLSSLELSYHKLRAVPDELHTLNSLRSLKFRYCNSLLALPTWLSTLQQLQELELHRCIQLKELPPLDQLPKLKRLQLYGCDSLELLPRTFGRAGAFPMLEELEISNCKKLKEFPKLEPGALSLLSRLHLMNADLSKLDNSITVLTKLRYLHLENCIHLATLPDSNSFLCLQNLEELKLYQANGITKLPKSISQLPQLKRLEIISCEQLQWLPWLDEHSEELFPKLEEVEFMKSSIQHIPLCVVSSTLKVLRLDGCKPDNLEPLREVLKTRGIDHYLLDPKA